MAEAIDPSTLTILMSGELNEAQIAQIRAAVRTVGPLRAAAKARGEITSRDSCT